MLARPSTPISSSTASLDCSINPTIGNSACPFRLRTRASAWVSCLWIVVMFFGGLL
jgi:hypothetical protein